MKDTQKLYCFCNVLWIYSYFKIKGLKIKIKGKNFNSSINREQTKRASVYGGSQSPSVASRCPYVGVAQHNESRPQEGRKLQHSPAWVVKSPREVRKASTWRGWSGRETAQWVRWLRRQEGWGGDLRGQCRGAGHSLSRTRRTKGRSQW